MEEHIKKLVKSGFFEARGGADAGEETEGADSLAETDKKNKYEF